ncbi:MAG: hypothetical protein Q8S11_06825 [Daejeonella sp.]|uniref:energy transducer TonB n=1 Tax=Daejeonella sp. TaxID=2805397 RepID=UPI0027335FC2|nr:hypothetical protein [Daejeonella sp.]MDP3468029.1 hypothetical protein [Daejeonella sp.]
MNTKYPDNLMISKYLEGKLDHEDMHRLEKQALSDPFLWEALEGYAHTSNPGTELSILQRQLNQRIVHLQENKKVFDFTWQRLSVAASASVLFITAGILFWMNISRPGAITEKQVQVSLIDRDSLNTEIHGSTGRPVISEKKYPVSSDETRIAAYSSTLKENNEPEVINPAPSSNNEALVASKSNQASKLRIQEPETGVLASSEGISASQQAVQPVTGWDIYRKYMEDNIRKPADSKVSGSVLLSFELDGNGKPANFQILKGLTADCNAEAIRLIRDGPAWRTRDGSKINTGRIEVRF